MRLLVAAVVVLRARASRAPGAARRSSPASTSARYDVAITIQPDGTLRIRETIDVRLRRTSRATASSATSCERERYDDDHDRRYRHQHRERDRRRGHAAPGEDDRRTARTCTCASAIPTRTITGVHRYAIVYTVRARRTTFADHDELYWDAIGNQWPVPIDQRARRPSRARDRSPRRVLLGTAGQLAPVRPARRPRASTRDVHPAVPRARTPGSRSSSRMPKGTIQPPPAADPREAQDARERVRDHAAHDRARRRARAARHRRSSSCSRTRRGRDRRYTGSAVDAAMGNMTGDEEPVPLLHRDAGPVEFIPPDEHPARPGRHARRRAGQPARRHRDDRRPRGARLSHDHRARPGEARTPPRLRAHRDAGQGQGHAAASTSSCSCTSCSTTATR